MVRAHPNFTYLMILVVVAIKKRLLITIVKILS